MQNKRIEKGVAGMKWLNDAVQERMQRLIDKYEMKISRGNRIAELLRQYTN